MPEIRSPIVFVRAKPSLTKTEWMLMVASAIALVCTFVWMARWELISTAPFKIANLARHPEILAYLIPISVAFVMRSTMKSARIVLDGSGIRMELNARGPMADFVAGRCRADWSELIKVSYLKSWAMLRFQSNARPFTLRANDWRLERNDGVTPAAVFGSSKSEPDLVRVLRELGVFEEYSPNSSLTAVDFDLLANRTSRTLLILLAIFVVYSFADAVIQSETWVFFDLHYLIPQIIVGVVAAVGWGLYCSTNQALVRIPSTIAWSLAFVVGIVVGSAAHVAGIRVNQVFGGPLKEAEYRRNNDCDKLEPIDKNLPIVEYSNLAHGYLCSIASDQTVTVLMRRGLFGLYQADLSAQTRAIRSYRMAH